MRTITFDELLASIERLPRDQQETLLDIIRNRLTEARRNEIARNAQDTLRAHKAGKAKKGTISELRKSLAK